MSVGWRAYHRLDQINGGKFDHQVVIHEENFVDPNNPEIHTQTIENLFFVSNSCQTFFWFYFFILSMQQSQLNEVKRARIIAYLEHEKTIMQVARELRIPKSTVGRIK
jgi:hypothetical protein